MAKYTKDRAKARLAIVQAANRHIVRGEHRWRFLGFMAPPTLLGMRQLERCVCIVRRNRLVSARTMVAAGFNPKGLA